MALIVEIKCPKCKTRYVGEFSAELGKLVAHLKITHGVPDYIFRKWAKGWWGLEIPER